MSNPTRKVKEVLLSDKKVTVHEFTVREIKSLWKEISTIDPNAINTAQLPPGLHDLWNVGITGLPFDDTDNYTPSELKAVFDAFREVNADFFDLLKQVEGENPYLVYLRKVVVSVLIEKFASYLPVAIPEPGITDTVSS